MATENEKSVLAIWDTTTRPPKNNTAITGWKVIANCHEMALWSNLQVRPLADGIGWDRVAVL
jgi:hypothetical protein